jgi:transposase
LISPLLPPPKKLGRKPTDFRVVLNAVFYMIRVGCPWRLLPKDFPPFTTVQNRFYAWRDSGLWPQIISVFVMAARWAADAPDGAGQNVRFRHISQAFPRYSFIDICASIANASPFQRVRCLLNCGRVASRSAGLLITQRGHEPSGFGFVARL